jgi:hypothetical protein
MTRQVSFLNATMSIKTTMISMETLYAIVPLLAPAWLLFRLVENPVEILSGWYDLLVSSWHEPSTPHEIPRTTSVGSQLLVYLTMAILGYISTYRLVPNIQVGILWFYNLVHDVLF